MGRSSSIAWFCLLLLATAGCDDENKRVAQMATEAAQRQAEQNKVMAQLQGQVWANCSF
jgi:hypothetical protein